MNADVQYRAAFAPLAECNSGRDVRDVPFVYTPRNCSATSTNQVSGSSWSPAAIRLIRRGTSARSQHLVGVGLTAKRRSALWRVQGALVT